LKSSKEGGDPERSIVTNWTLFTPMASKTCELNDQRIIIQSFPKEALKSVIEGMFE
jgi:hypothetical protein